MKQLLFLLLFPCLAMAQYPGNAGQKITLGEQTTADGLVWRGRTSDTVNLMTNKIDTSAYLVLDTITQAIWLYRASTTPKWNRVVDSLNNLQGQLSLTTKVTGVLPVANGGTNNTSYISGAIPYSNGTSLTSDTSRLFYDNTNSRLAINTTNFTDPIAGFSKVKFVDGTMDLSFRDNSTGQGYLAVGSRTNNIKGFLGHTNTDEGFVMGTFSNHRIVLRTNNINRFFISNNGNTGIGQLTPTARLHLAAGTATASTAPLKFTSQGASLLNPAEAGAVEFNGTNLFFSPSNTRHTVNHGLTGSATLNFPSTTTLLSADLTITVTGAADGDVVSLGVPNAAVNANTSYSAWVSAANTVTVRFNNYSSGTVDPASALFKVFVTK